MKGETVDRILNEDSVKVAVDALCEDIKDFDEVDFVHLLWAKKGKKPQGGYYGELDALLANLEKAKFQILVVDGLEGEEAIENPEED